jgi:hypothetical protein
MGSAAPKKRPMRSIRSGIKKLELVKANLAVLKKIAMLIIVIFIVSCNTPYHIVETITTDSTGKQVHTIQKYYSDGTSMTPQASFNITSTPFFYHSYPIVVPQQYIPYTIIRGHSHGRIRH